MTQRINYAQASPNGFEAMRHLQEHVENSGLEDSLLELVKRQISAEHIPREHQRTGANFPASPDWSCGAPVDKPRDAGLSRAKLTRSDTHDILFGAQHYGISGQRPKRPTGEA